MFSGDTCQTCPFLPAVPTRGVSWSPPCAGPLRSLDGGVSAPHEQRRPGSCSLTIPSFVLSRVSTYLSGPRARCGHGPRSSFPGSGSIPRRLAARLREPGPAPASGLTNRAVPVAAAPNPRVSRPQPPAGPASGAAASFCQRPGRGGAAARWSRTLGRPQFLPWVGGLGSRDRSGT